jgi:xanthine dehydrogenase accessory factor
MMAPDARRVTVAGAARAVLDARAGDRAVAVIGRADERGGGVRVLVFEDGEVRGTLGDRDLNRAAREIGARLLESSEDSAWTLETADGEATLYAEVHRRPARLFVVGAGHIGLAVARTGVLLGFPVAVLDDREEFASGDRFPEAASVRRVDFADPFVDDRPDAADFVVLVTRAHRYDFDCLRVLLTGSAMPRYVGMVGSRRRVRAAFRQLLDAEVPRERVTAVYAPIGLEIGAETPEEIAVSIMAEIVAVRRGTAAGGSLRDGERIVERLIPDNDGTGRQG